MVKLMGMHDMFHVSMLKKYIYDPSHMLIEPPEELLESLQVEHKPVTILPQLRSKAVPIVKVLWRSSELEQETWETVAEMNAKYPTLFSYALATLVVFI